MLYCACNAKAGVHGVPRDMYDVSFYVRCCTVQVRSTNKAESWMSIAARREWNQWTDGMMYEVGWINRKEIGQQRGNFLMLRRCRILIEVRENGVAACGGAYRVRRPSDCQYSNGYTAVQYRTVFLEPGRNRNWNWNWMDVPRTEAA